MNPIDDQELSRRFRVVCRLTDDYLNQMGEAERDRMLQVHLAQARGPLQNLRLALAMTDLLLSARQERAPGSVETS